MDHLAQQEDAFSGIFVDRPEGDLDGILYAVAEAEMPGEIDMQAAEVQMGRAEILFQLILLFASGLDGRDKRAAVDDRDFETLHDAAKVQKSGICANFPP